MKAVVITKYGPPEVLQVQDLPKPIPKRNEILINVHSTTAHFGDTRIRGANPFLVRLIYGLFSPRKNLIPGLEVSGVIEEVGSEVQSFKKGDEVFALTGFGLGGYAEFITLPEKVKQGTQEKKGLVAMKPRNLSFEEAAVVPAGGLTALKNIQKASIQKGQKMLINGASGSLGTYAIQLAKYQGAEVTAVCSGKNFELVKTIGADHTIDYTKVDFTRSEKKYDIVYDAVMKSSRGKCQRILQKGGIFLNNSGLPKIQDKDLIYLKGLIENNHLKPVMDRTYPLSEVVEAHRHVEQGHKKGNVAIRISPLQ